MSTKMERALDETRDNITKSIDEAIREIPRNTQAINDYQEHTLQASKEIADSYLESQKEFVNAFQSMIVPYIENGYKDFWYKWTSPATVSEIYARAVSNFADNEIVVTKIANNAMFGYMEAFKTFIQRQKDNAKAFSRIAANTAKTFEQTSKDFHASIRQ